MRRGVGLQHWKLHGFGVLSDIGSAYEDLYKLGHEEYQPENCVKKFEYKINGRNALDEALRAVLHHVRQSHQIAGPARKNHAGRGPWESVLRRSKRCA